MYIRHKHALVPLRVSCTEGKGITTLKLSRIVLFCTEDAELEATAFAEREHELSSGYGIPNLLMLMFAYIPNSLKFMFASIFKFLIVHKR